MIDRNDLDVIINNQRVLMAALVKTLKLDGAGKHEEAIDALETRLIQLHHYFADRRR